MSLVETLLQSVWLPVAAVALLWAETAALCLLAEQPLARFKLLAGNVLAGTCLITALGIALQNGPGIFILGALTLSLAAHALDVYTRLASPPDNR
ncbi:hypothetical protein E1180_00465 [Roseibium denhamense]|uniref:Uncharacterized protein n=1 Tax=Roseibium denhamense TaxID=76305 RepID=A0ABY1PKM6_9HYPH|nr:hypothetical protein [Roseibium denhamense]MTI03993.1 hypothetical protein [Roseibium denhamense]SMP36127.1 hypothetical protein SAMN06265374_4120 [Roseibium denhamense]